jgi:hypothetical protein
MGMRLRIPLALASLALGIAACERATSPSAPGPVPVTLVSQFTDDGAALVEFRGDIQSVSAPAGTAVYWEARSGGVTQVLLVRDFPGTIQFTVHLANRSKRPEALVLDVSDAMDIPRDSATARTYRVQY